MRRHRAIRCIILLAALALPASCGRTGVESEPGPAYALEVTNPRPYPMIISYDDGSGVRLLGIVQPNGATRFVITTPASREITVFATDEPQTRSVTRAVTLQPGEVTTVDLGT